AALGGAVGLLLAFWGVRTLHALFPPTIFNLSIPRVDEIPLDGRVLGFTLAISLLTGAIFGLIPALQVSKTDVNESLKEGERSSAGGFRSRRLRSLLVVSEVALALMLLIGAGLMIKSFLHLQERNLGFNPEKVLTMRIVLPQYKYANVNQRRAFHQ